jgi:phosphoglycerol transferase MdoB-like AlkP superfamily enzyme
MAHRDGFVVFDGGGRTRWHGPRVQRIDLLFRFSPPLLFLSLLFKLTFLLASHSFTLRAVIKLGKHRFHFYTPLL